MFETVKTAPPDPILGLTEAFNKDPNPDKINLSVGVYKDGSGKTPVLATVKEAERRLLEGETTKSYLPMPGDPTYGSLVQKLMFGDNHAIVAEGRGATAHCPGGTGALRVAGDYLHKLHPGSAIWLSDPTWANHPTVFGAAGMEVKTYAYRDPATNGLDFNAMLESLDQVPAGDVVLLHGCCHNPCGADLTLDQWQALTELALQQGFTPFVDVAYQGLGAGLEQDAAGWRRMAERVPEMLIASSCSKNFGLYRERTGALALLAQNEKAAAAGKSQALSAARQSYSMPPSHGALIAGLILQEPELRESWQVELEQMRTRIVKMRAALAEQLGGGFAFIRQEFGMFSFLGISPDQVSRLREEYGIYMVESTRINIAGLNDRNLDYFVQAMRSL
jgi:aspartate/tyrosine/aromatic aminotransferase